MWNPKESLGRVNKDILYCEIGFGETLAPDPHFNSTLQYIFGGYSALMYQRYCGVTRIYYG